MKICFWIPKNIWGARFQAYFQEHWENSSVREVVLHEQVWLEISSFSGLKEGAPYTFNPPEALENVWNDARRKEIFTLNRIPYLKAEENLLRFFEVLVLDQTILFMRMLQDGGRWKYVKFSSYVPVADLAKKAPYLLGIDFALVQVGMDTQRHYGVKKIDIVPELREKDFTACIHIIERLKYTLPNTGGRVMLGADPEFMLANSRTGKMMPASDFFPRSGKVGCDDVRSRSRKKRPVAEVHPDPDESPFQLAENILDTLREAGRLAPYRSVKWLAGSRPFKGFCTGGHVHFSQIIFNGHLLRALDVYAALPAFLLEVPETAASRRRRYGMLGDFRMKNHGGFEYRTMASWLISPEWTQAVLCLCKLVAESYPVLKSHVFLDPAMQKNFYQGEREKMREIVLQEIYPELQSLRAYELYYEPLEWFFKQIKNKNCWNEKNDIRQNWGIIPGYSKNKKSR